MGTGFNINSKGYVVYKEPPSASPIWRAVVEKQTNLVNNALNNIGAEDSIFSVQKTIEMLDNLYVTERTKELALLEKLGLKKEILDDSSFFKEFNILVGNEEHLKAAVERMQYALEHEEIKFAPSLVVHFTSYLVTAIGKETDNAIQRAKKTGDFNIDYDSFIKKAINSAFKKFFSAEKKNPWVYGEEFKALEEAYEKSKNEYISLFANLYKQTFEESFKKVAEKVAQGSRKGLSKDLKGIWEGNRGKQGVGGNIQEYIVALVVDSFSKNGIKTESHVVANKIATTDVVSLFSSKGTIDLNKALFPDADSKQEIRQNLKKMYDSNLLNLSKDDIIMYTSSKMYRINGENFSSHGYNDGGSYNLLNFIKNITDNTSKNTLDDLYEVLINTASGEPGGILKDLSMREYYTRIIAQQCAKIFFDDWDEGMKATFMDINNGPQAIHVFNLNDLFFPFSILINKMKEALSGEEKLSNYFSLSSFNFKTTTIFPKHLRQEIYSETSHKDNVVALMWEEQANKSYKDYEKASFKIRFGKALIRFIDTIQ